MVNSILRRDNGFWYLYIYKKMVLNLNEIKYFEVCVC